MAKEKNNTVKLSDEELRNHEARKEFFDNRLKDQEWNRRVLSDMTTSQSKSITDTIEALDDALRMIHECNDLYLSQVSKLHECFWALQNNFDTGQKE
jgi:hypothetical protein